MALSLSSSSLAIKSISELSNKENAPGEKVTRIRIGSLRVPGLRSLSSFGVLGSSSLNDTKPEVKFELPNGEEVVLGECSGWSQSVAQVPVRLHVSNLPFRYREHNLVQLFSRVGSVLEAEVIYNDRGSKGFGFITMASREDASTAQSRLHRTVVDGRPIQVNYATPKKVATPGEVGQVVRPRVSPRDLVEAEIKLALAQLQVDMMRLELML